MSNIIVEEVNDLINMIVKLTLVSIPIVLIYRFILKDSWKDAYSKGLKDTAIIILLCMSYYTIRLFYYIGTNDMDGLGVFLGNTASFLEVIASILKWPLEKMTPG